MVSVWVFGEAAFGALLIQSHAEGSDEKRELSLKILRPTFIVSTLALATSLIRSRITPHESACDRT